MKTVFRIALGVALVAGLAGLALAGPAADKPVTLTGDVMCGKCTLKKADLKDCQDVLVVKGDHAGEYYLAKNDVLDTFGHTCTGTKAVTVTGTVTEKDGTKWLTATKMDAVAKKS